MSEAAKKQEQEQQKITWELIASLSAQRWQELSEARRKAIITFMAEEPRTAHHKRK